MRVLYIVHQFFPEFESGTERVTLRLARMMQRAGHHVQVLACTLQRGRFQGQPTPEIPGALSGVVDGVPVTMLDRASLPAGAEVSFDVARPQEQAIGRWLQQQRFDLAHVLHTMRMASAVAAVQKAALPMVLTLTDFFLPCFRINLIDLEGQLCQGPEGGRRCQARCASPGWPANMLTERHLQARALIDAAAVCVAPSAYAAARLQAAFEGVRFQVLAHGVDVLARPAAAVRAAAMDVVTFGFIGSILPAKGLHILLQALAAVPDLKLSLKVAGGHHGDAAYRQQIETLVAADPRVQMLGQLSADEVATTMAGLDALCIPSLVPESFSLVLHECAAASVPSIVSGLGAPAELINRDGGGCVVPAGDVAAWASALRNATLRPELLAQWRSHVRPPQRIEEEAFLYESLYRGALC